MADQKLLNEEKVKIKMQELRYVKERENHIDSKTNLIALIIGIFLSAALGFFFSSYRTASVDKRIIFLVLVAIALLLLLISVYPKNYIRKNNQKWKNHNLLKMDDYQPWDVNFLESLEVQIEISLYTLKIKRIYCRYLIIFEFAIIVGLGVLILIHIQ